MSKNAKISIVIIIAIVLVGAIWMASNHRSQTSLNTENSNTNNMETAASIPLTKGNSNQELDQDLASIDSQMKSMNNDSADIDQSFNDKPIQQ